MTQAQQVLDMEAADIPPAKPIKGAAKAAKEKAAQAVATIEPMKAPALQTKANQGSEVLELAKMVERLATNPDVDIEKLRAGLEMIEHIQDRTAKANFDAALAEMQPNLPTITQSGLIEIKAKDAKGDRNGPVTQSTKFAKLEDIVEAIRPTLGQYGFSLSFRTGLTDDGRIKVTGILAGHGHREETMMVLPHDSSGSKNAVQAIGSSTTYGKRYVTCALLNIVTRAEDDDGVAGGAVATITQEQAYQITDMIEATGSDRKRFLQHIGVDTLEQMPASKFQKALDALKAKASK